MKLYTRHGDDGTTGLFGGQRVDKDSLRVTAYGVVDELNSALGLARCACTHDELAAIIDRVQPQLFVLGSNLCLPAGETSEHVPPLTDQHVQQLESLIDAVCAPLPEMRYFILPGGCELAARLHVARTTCRAAERAVVRLAHAEPVEAHLVQYLNRLSDLLFAMARRANQLEGVEDVPWKP
ncbi:cob(I)yrinic acid a,c-diamide adenosyltransferase [Planctomycetales bacterium ZRK34]|nr:cob(I)yrinic acid a,c-diamide adenosyltransferase [Planctomycetales bacterium ZRK34]